MGLFRRKPPAEVVEKAVVPGLSALPSGAVTTDLTPMANALAQQIVNAFGPQGTTFGPGMPFAVQPLDPREPSGSPAPRVSQFPVSVNLQLVGDRLVPFKVLRDASNSEVLRACIRTRVSHMLALDWDIVLSKKAVSRVMAAEGISSPGKAWQFARRKFEPEMVRLQEWWQKPDAYNGLDFSAWLGMLMEEQLTIDAATVWPRRNLGGGLMAFELIDGGTIKPLRDHRGSTPSPPAPAFQQILHGFPRGEWAASGGDVPAFKFDELIYRPRYRRTWTPYGYSEVEQALSVLDIYFKRMGWIRGSFDESSIPDMFMKTDINVTGPNGMTASQLAAYEAALNGELAGQVAERRRIKLLAKGFEPSEQEQFGDKFQEELDDFLIKLQCMCFSVMPTEIGFPPRSGIGGKGHQEGEANSAMRKELRPTVDWLKSLLTDLSRRYLGMPPELEFGFIGYEVEDQEATEKVLNSQFRRGGVTLNESRATTGMPLFEFDEADEPLIQTSTGAVFLRGLMSAPVAPGTPGAEPSPADPTAESSASPNDGSAPAPPDGETLTAGDTVPDGMVAVTSHVRRLPTRAEIAAEGAKFAAFARKRLDAGKWRPFEFAVIDSGVGEYLNELGAAGGIESIRAVVTSLGKAKARAKPGRVTPETKAKLATKHGKALAGAARSMIGDTAALVAGFDASKAAAPISDNQVRARAYVTDNIDDGTLEDAVDDMLTDGYEAGLEALDVDPDEVPAKESRFANLDRDVIVAGLALTIAAGVADALLSRDDPAAAIDAYVSPENEAWATTAAAELTDPITAGVQDGSKVAGVENVRLVSDGGCEFCDGYDGRIMAIDDDEGMPPLHPGCQCDIEPLEPGAPGE